MGQGLIIKVAQIVADELAGRPRRGARSPPPTPARCRTPRRPRPRPAPTSTAWRRRPPRARSSARLIDFAAAALRACAAKRSFSRRRGADRRAGDAASRELVAAPTSPASRSRRPASTARRRSTTTAQRARAGRSTTSPTAPRSRGGDRHPHRRVPPAARRPAARRRPLDQPGDRPRPDRGRLRPGHGLAHHRGAGAGTTRGALHDPRARRPTRSRRRSDLPPRFPRRALRDGQQPRGRRSTARRRSASRR